MVSPLPTHARMSNTKPSRSASIGGFVTCAKRWRRYSVTGTRRPKNGSAASSPIDQTGSAPAASGETTPLSSSCVYPKRTRSRRSAASSIAGATGSGISKRQDATVARKSAPAPRDVRNASGRISSPVAKRTAMRSPGPSRPRSTIGSAPKSTMPASDAASTLPDSVRHQRIGRKPLRSSAAPTRSPSAKTIAAGPSHGSTVGTCAS